MTPLELDPHGSSGSYKLIGGRSFLDLVNTISWRGQPGEHDWLTTPVNLDAWAHAIGLDAPPANDADLTPAHRVRATLSGVMGALAHHVPPSSAAVTDFRRLLARARRRQHLDIAAGMWTWAPASDFRQALDPLIVDAAEFLVSGPRRRLKHCPACDWLFIDATRSDTRRWCDMADCGSRAKSSRHYRRANPNVHDRRHMVEHGERTPRAAGYA